MIINDLLKEKNMTMYQLSKLSGVPQSTISDLCSGKTAIEKCTFGNVYKIAMALNVPIEHLATNHRNRDNFDLYRSNVCHKVKELGHIGFLIESLENNEVEKLFNEKYFYRSLYLLSMIDYLSRINSIPLCMQYEHIRQLKIEETVFPSSVLIKYMTTNDPKIKEEAIKKSIPEFILHNIVESEIEKVA